jgi:uncharacterized protein (TIGR00295 family)
MLRESGCDRDVIEHSIAVETLAVSIARLCTDDARIIEEVSQGALLHDIGRSRTHGIRHAVEGAAILGELGLDEALVLIAERHIGAGLTSEEARELGLPEKDYIPETLTEKIVAQADNLIGHRDRAAVRMSLSEALERARKKDLMALVDRMKRLHEELSQMCGMNLDEI